MEVAIEWMNHLPGNFNDELMVSMLANKPETTKDLIGEKLQVHVPDDWS
jgi:hypothetical protein